MGKGRQARRAGVTSLALAGLLAVAALSSIGSFAYGAAGAAGNHEARQTIAASPAVSDSTHGSEASAVRVKGSVLGSRAVVVDERGVIVAIFSNTPDPMAPVVVRLGSVSGPELDPTPSVMHQYEKLAARVNWGSTGLVYQQP